MPTFQGLPGCARRSVLNRLITHQGRPSCTHQVGAALTTVGADGKRAEAYPARGFALRFMSDNLRDSGISGCRNPIRVFSRVSRSVPHKKLRVPSKIRATNDAVDGLNGVALESVVYVNVGGNVAFL
jgi:hypothetical protein